MSMTNILIGLQSMGIIEVADNVITYCCHSAERTEISTLVVQNVPNCELKRIEEAKDQHSVDMERRASQRAINRINVGNRL